MKISILTFNYENANYSGSEILAVKKTRQSAEKVLSDVISAIQNGKKNELDGSLSIVGTEINCPVKSMRIKQVTPSYYEITDDFSGDNFSFVITNEEVTD